MDGENYGTPYQQMGWFGGENPTPYFWEGHPYAQINLKQPDLQKCNLLLSLWY